MFLLYDDVKANAKLATSSKTGEIVPAATPPEFREYKPSKQMLDAAEKARKWHTEIPSLVR